jgi:hypothetical protein
MQNICYYHYCARHERKDGSTVLTDGIFRSFHPVNHPEFYSSMRKVIANGLGPDVRWDKDLIVTSLSLVGSYHQTQ